MGYIALGIRRVIALEKEISVLEEAVARRA